MSRKIFVEVLCFAVFCAKARLGFYFTQIGADFLKTADFADYVEWERRFCLGGFYGIKKKIKKD